MFDAISGVRALWRSLAAAVLRVGGERAEIHVAGPQRFGHGHRHFGLGTVIELQVDHPFTAIMIRFNEEGVKQLSLPTR